MTAMTFAVGGMAVWIPTFFYERESVFQVQPATIEHVRKLEEPGAAQIAERIQPLVGQSFQGMDNLRAALSGVLTRDEVMNYRAVIAKHAQDEKVGDQLLADINYQFGLVVVVTGLFATLSGGWLGDKLRPLYSGSYFLVSGIGMLFGLPAFIAAVTVPLPMGWYFVYIAVFCLFFNTGPANTILANVSHPAVRSSAFALNILIIHLFGDVASPPIVGWVADHYSLLWGMYVLSGAILISGLVWIWGARYLERDTALAPTRI
jgi:MFS family permease